MRWGILLLVAGTLSQTGCLLARNVAHNLANESAEHLDERKLSRQLRAEARDGWAAFCQQSGGSFSIDFADGFRDGYADYLESGGNGSPPAVPPLRYRRSAYLNPEGHARIRDYFAGFKTGVDAAAESGRRHFLTVPVLVSDDAPPVPPPGIQVPSPDAPLRAGEQLPAPRRMDATTGLPIPDRPSVEPLPPPLPVPKVPEPPPAPQSKTAPEPAVTPVAAAAKAPPEWPAFHRRTPPPVEPPVRRTIDRD